MASECNVLTIAPEEMESSLTSYILGCSAKPMHRYRVDEEGEKAPDQRPEKQNPIPGKQPQYGKQ